MGPVRRLPHADQRLCAHGSAETEDREENLLTPIIEKQINAADTERTPEPDPGKTEEQEPIDVDESHGLAARPKRLKAGTHPKAELMKEMARSGASLTEIMEVAGCSEPTARKYMKEATE